MVIHCDREVLDNNVVMDFMQKADMCNIPENTTKLMAPYSKDWTGPQADNESREQDPAELTREDQTLPVTRRMNSTTTGSRGCEHLPSRRTFEHRVRPGLRKTETELSRLCLNRCETRYP